MSLSRLEEGGDNAFLNRISLLGMSKVRLKGRSFSSLSLRIMRIS